MSDTTLRSSQPAAANAAIAIAAIGVAAILGAYFFQYVVKLAPCPLCLEQRVPYYIAIPLALVVAYIAGKGAPRSLVTLGLVLLVVAALVSAGLGVYHAGIEWKLWVGPTECTGDITSFNGGDLMSQIRTTSVVRCDEAQWRLFGISLAGYNVLVSLLLAAIGAAGILRSR